jgi:hypothetical protein
LRDARSVHHEVLIRRLKEKDTFFAMLLNGKVGQTLRSDMEPPDPQGAWIRNTDRNKTWISCAGK